jgi:hypothetical protein
VREAVKEWETRSQTGRVENEDNSTRAEPEPRKSSVQEKSAAKSQQETARENDR